MGFLRDNFKRWIQEKKAAGFIALLSDSSDAHAVLESQRSNIDDIVIDELLTHSYYVSKTVSLEEGLRWAEAAQEASMLGGSATALARCFTSKSLLFLNLHRRDRADDATKAGRPAPGHDYLDEALFCALKALSIYEDAGASAEITPANGLVSTIYENREEALPAIQYRLASLVGWAELPDAADALPEMLGNLAGLLGQLEDDELEAGCRLVLTHAKELNEAAGARLDAGGRGKLLEALGAAHGGLDAYDDALTHWERALRCYREAGRTKDAFRLLKLMQECGVRAERLDVSIRWGEECVKCAPEDLAPGALGAIYHFLAATYNWAGRAAEAAEAHHQAARLYKLDGLLVGEGGCLLQAAICEEEAGMFDKSREDLERALQCSGGTFGYWIACNTLANLLWRRYGDLGAAAEKADEALKLAMSTPNLTLRAASLLVSGLLHLSSGDNERALTRAEALLELRPDGLRPTTIVLDKLFEQAVLPPTTVDTILLGYIASVRMNRPEDARRYGELYSSLARTEYPPLGGAPNEEDWGDDDSAREILQGLGRLAQAEQLIFVDPREALAPLEEASSLFRKHGILNHLASARRDMAQAKLLTGDVEGARSCLEEVLDLLKQAPNHTEEFTCRYLLGKLASMASDSEAAYAHLKSAITLLEAERTSLGEDRQRQLFLEVGPYLDAYTILVAVCIQTGRAREAIESVEKMKSRVLLDLLAQGGRGRIDYATLDQLRELSKERDRWIRLHAVMDAEQLGEWGHIAVMEDSIAISQRTSDLKQQLQHDGLFFRFSLQDEPVTFREIRELCRTS
jgi:pentatricopeptide repeat protein